MLPGSINGHSSLLEQGTVLQHLSSHVWKKPRNKGSLDKYACLPAHRPGVGPSADCRPHYLATGSNSSGQTSDAKPHHLPPTLLCAWCWGRSRSQAPQP